MASLIDSVGERFKSGVLARRRSLRETDEDRGVDRATAQAQFEARRAQEDAARAAKRGPTVPREELNRQEADRWSQIWILRNFRSEIATEHQRLIAAVHAAVELGDLEDALAAQSRLAVLGPVDAIAVQRLMANGVEAK